MKPISFEESKKIEFDILCYVADFCDKNGIEYMLAYGTLIGAIRHKGFIPWDDDIDLWMKRSDYNKMIEMFNEKKEKDCPYYLVSPYHKGAKHTFVKIIDTRTIKKEFGFKYKHLDFGVDLDIFPLDGAPNDPNEMNVWFNKLHPLYVKHLYNSFCLHGGFKNKIKIFLYKLRNFFTSVRKNKLLDKANALHAEYPYDQCKVVKSIETAYSTKNKTIDKKHFEGTVDVEFEGRLFKAPKDYHEVLTLTFGDYMTPPPEKDRVTHHKNEVYWK